MKVLRDLWGRRVEREALRIEPAYAGEGSGTLDQRDRRIIDAAAAIDPDLTEWVVEQQLVLALARAVKRLEERDR